MNLPGTPITKHDQRKILDPRWIDSTTAAGALLRRVDSPTGCQLVGRSGARSYEGIAIPYFLPGNPVPVSGGCAAITPEMEYQDGKRKAQGQIHVAAWSA